MAMTRPNTKDKQAELGRRLRHARGRAGFGTVEAARALGFDHATLSEIEAGRRKVDIFELADLWQLYRIDPDVLLVGLIEMTSKETK